MNNTWLEKHSLWLIGLALAALLILTLLAVTRRPPESPAHTTLSIVYVIATPTAEIMIQHTNDPRPALPRALPAYAAPDGDLLGAVDSGRRYTIEARSGSAWALIQVEGIGGFDGNGSVWVKSDELSGIEHAPDLATMTPAPAAPPAQVVYAPAPTPDTLTLVPTVDPTTISSTGTPCGLMPGGCYLPIPLPPSGVHP